MTHKNDGFIENLMKVPAPLKLSLCNSLFIDRRSFVWVYQFRISLTYDVTLQCKDL